MSIEEQHKQLKEKGKYLKKFIKRCEYLLNNNKYSDDTLSSILVIINLSGDIVKRIKKDVPDIIKTNNKDYNNLIMSDYISNIYNNILNYEESDLYFFNISNMLMTTEDILMSLNKSVDTVVNLTESLFIVLLDEDVNFRKDYYKYLEINKKEKIDKHILNELLNDNLKKEEYWICAEIKKVLDR